MARRNDYAAACTAMLFVLEQAWDAFTAWNEANTGMSPPRAEMTDALAALDKEYMEAANG